MSLTLWSLFSEEIFLDKGEKFCLEFSLSSADADVHYVLRRTVKVSESSVRVAPHQFMHFSLENSLLPLFFSVHTQDTACYSGFGCIWIELAEERYMSFATESSAQLQPFAGTGLCSESNAVSAGISDTWAFYCFSWEFCYTAHRTNHRILAKWRLIPLWKYECQ